MVEESFNDLINVVNWLNIFSNKLDLDIWKYSNGVRDRLKVLSEA